MKAHARLKPHILTDTDQSAWQMAAIQLTGVTSLPVLFASLLIIEKNSLFNSLILIVSTNLFLWLIRLGLISLSHKNRKSVIDISRDFFEDIWGLKNVGIYFIAALLLLSTIALFVEETTIISTAITKLFTIYEGPSIDPFMQVSVLIGVISTLFCTWGIVALRWLATFALPFILAAFIALLFLNPTTLNLSAPQGFSLSAIPLVLGINLAVTADLPTFFRHSKSWKSSVHALTIIQLVSLALGIGGLFLGAIIGPFTESTHTIGSIFLHPAIKASFIVLVILSSICSNVSNVYSASVGWEVVAPTALISKKEYLILGLLLTMIFISITGLISFKPLVDITNACLVNLSFVFVLGYVISLISGKSINKFDRSIYFFAWFISSVVNIFQLSGVFLASYSTLAIGLGLLAAIILLPQVFKNKLIKH